MSDPAVRSARALVGAALLCALVAGPGCIGGRVVYPVMPTGEELLVFEAAGPDEPWIDAADVASMQVAGPYRVVPGDLLAFELPPEADIDSAKSEASPGVLSIKSRVKEDGTVLLPMVGAQHVAGKTTTQIEAELAAAYADESRTRLEVQPNVVVTVSEFRTVNVAVVGAVNQPGLVELRSDHMTVVGALAAAGGIKAERGVKEIRILGKDEAGQPSTLTLDMHLAEIPLADVGLRGGETIVVEPAPERAFSVIGLVKKSGVFQYPLPRRYNLMQALATAGGVDETAAPRYATIYRTALDGKVVGATFKIDGTSLTDGPTVLIKDGDVIAVEHTQGSWLRQFFSQVFGFRASVNVSGTSAPTL
jgi:protein involved in polysaccharide export with SLBB domain